MATALIMTAHILVVPMTSRLALAALKEIALTVKPRAIAPGLEEHSGKVEYHAPMPFSADTLNAEYEQG